MVEFRRVSAPYGGEAPEKHERSDYKGDGVAVDVAEKSHNIISSPFFKLNLITLYIQHNANHFIYIYYTSRRGSGGTFPGA